MTACAPVWRPVAAGVFAVTLLISGCSPSGEFSAPPASQGGGAEMPQVMTS